IGSLFHIKGVQTHIVRNKIGEPEQFVMIETSSAARSEDIAKTLQIRRLPKSNPHRAEAKKDDAEESGDAPDPNERRRHRHESSDDDNDADADSIPPAERDGRYHISQMDDLDDSEENAAAAEDADKYDDWAPDEIDADALAL